MEKRRWFAMARTRKGDLQIWYKITGVRDGRELKRNAGSTYKG